MKMFGWVMELLHLCRLFSGEDSYVGGIMCGRNPMWEKSHIGGILLEGILRKEFRGEEYHDHKDKLVLEPSII